MRIKAKYVVALVIIVGAVLAAPFLDGLYFKQNFYELIQARSANFGTPIEITEYNLGWLSSTATLTITPPNNPQVKITVNQIITHGPIIADPDSGDHKLAEATIQSHIHLDKKYELYLTGSSANSESGVMGIFTWVSFMHHFKNHFQSAVFNIKVPGPTEGKITWAGISGDIETDFKHNFALENFKTSLVSAPMYIQNSDHNVQISPQTIEGEGNCGKYLFCVGHSSLSIPLVNLTTANVNARINNIAYQVESDIDEKDNFSGKLNFNFTSFAAQDYSIGPVSLVFNVKNINSVSMHKLMEAMHDAGQSATPSNASALILLGQLSAEAPQLITPHFTMMQTTNIGSTYGNFSSTFNMTWPAGTPLPKTVNDLMQATIKFHATAATSLVDQIIMSADQKAAEAQPVEATPLAAAAPVNTTGKPQSFDEMLAPMMGQGLSTDEIKNIVALSQKNVPADAFNTYIDGRIAIRKIPAALGPELKKDYVTVLNTPFQNVAANAGAYKQLDVWVRENKITSDTRAALIQLQKQGLSSEIYNASIDDIVSEKRLPTDLGEQLKTQYASTNPESSFGGGDDTVAATAASTADQGGELRKKFDAEVQQGFILQNKDSYSIDIDYQHGELKVNGKAVPVPNPFS
jgi:uncharacterized protein YdgA (DUF945 family)